MFCYWVKDGSWPYQVMPRKVVYGLPGTPERGGDRKNKNQLLLPLDNDRTSEWCNSFILVANMNS